MRRLGCNDARSRSPISGPNSALSSSVRPMAILRSSRIIRPASAATLGSRSGPKTIRAIANRVVISPQPRLLNTTPPARPRRSDPARTDPSVASRWTDRPEPLLPTSSVGACRWSTRRRWRRRRVDQRHAPTDDVGSSGSGRSVHRLATLGSVRAGSDRRGRAGGVVFNNLGWGEITTLFAIALIVFGPERLPKVAADAGRMIRELRKMAIGLTDELKAELGPEIGDLDLASLHPKRLLEAALLDEDGNESAAAAGPGSGAVARSGPELAVGESAPYDLDAT